MKLIFLGTPQPQLRPRATRVGNSIRLYDPKKTADYKQYIRDTASLQWKHGQLEGALHVKIDVYRPIQKSDSKKNKEKKAQGIIRPTVKPDSLNYGKGIEDALNGIVWKDDSQIVDIHVSKHYSNKPRVELEVRCLD